MAVILLIDSDDSFRRVMQLRLTALGYTVLEARERRQGLEVFRTSRPQLVVVEVARVDVDGLAAVNAIRQESPGTKLIAIAADGQAPADSYLNVAKAMGAAFGFRKPFALDELSFAVTSLVPVADALAKFSFLVVDDDPVSKHLNRELLTAEFPGCEVFDAETVASALMICSTRSIDAVITDHHLGHSEGSEFVGRLRSLGRNCPVVMVTASIDPDVHARAYQAGADRVFAGGDSDFVSHLRTVLALRTRAKGPAESGGAS